ncbi:hypothetical protein Rsub_11878 [Raphidocelis subcapitata]|uniref:Nudix hydrolase domain-containing protein n=1 Tax=Raphidocelis subcapitata TaxID=307507 RepID=A0A2V0PFC5_9CHLO|nr:hypothetical protein Rsub_11878 [Raphidocelis subcapitata]|eukprot:GBF98548.1 hypothetical protein Rsub_11878 [Raphidocelis subcapitata]
MRSACLGRLLSAGAAGSIRGGALRRSAARASRAHGAAPRPAGRWATAVCSSSSSSSGNGAGGDGDSRIGSRASSGSGHPAASAAAGGPPTSSSGADGAPPAPALASTDDDDGGSSTGFGGKGPLPTAAMPLQQFEISTEEILHKRYLTLYNRRVRFTAPGHDVSRDVNFDVVGHPQSAFRFAVTFPFHPYRDRKGGEVTVIREYAQGPNSLMYCLPTGGFDPRKHTDLEACAKAELSEEAWLKGGRWLPLLAPDHPGLAEVKWCVNRFRPFLVVDPVADADPGSRDLEEVTLEVLRMPLEEFRALMISGDMLLPSIATSYLAIDKLKEEGYL